MRLKELYNGILVCYEKISDTLSKVFVYTMIGCLKGLEVNKDQNTNMCMLLDIIDVLVFIHSFKHR